MHGAMTLLEAGDRDPFNTAVLIDPGGGVLLHHRKVPTCSLGNPESACSRGRGFEVATIDTSAGLVTVGLMICMDREYPDAAATPRPMQSTGRLRRLPTTAASPPTQTGTAVPARRRAVLSSGQLAQFAQLGKLSPKYFILRHFRLLSDQHVMI